jgi:predicted DNA binding CopG/RHH family protein
MEGPMNPAKLPQTDSIQELAKFWDTHDLTDFENELEEAQPTVFQREEQISVRLQHDEAEALRKMATSQGIPDSELIRQWVIERIQTL